MIFRYQQYIKENSDQTLIKLKEICLDSIQEIIDLKLHDKENFKLGARDYSEFWEKENGYYDIDVKLDKDFYSNIITIKTEIRIANHTKILSPYIVTKLGGLLYRLDRIGFISKMPIVTWNSITYAVIIESYIKLADIKI